MYSDNMYAQVVDKLLERFYKGSPYEYNVLGNTESLKKPSLTEMSKFFQKYYVGNNMGLMICGDFNSEEILPILEKTFGRIPAGEAKPKSEMQIAGFNGRESMKVKIPVPVVKATGRFWRGPAAYTQDIITLEVLCSLLNNSNNTGYLDKLVQDNKLLMAEALCINDVYESGMIGFVAIPKLIFQSKSSAEKLAMQQIEKIKKGDFSEDELNAIKLQLRRGMLSQLENTDTRMENMISDFSKGLTWEEGIEMIANIDKLTKEDIIECANKYFTDNYLSVSKKYGSYPKDRLVKPDIQSIPFDEKSASERSAYYDSLNVYDKTDVNLKYVNFEEDCSTIDLGNNCKLYLKSINTNALFAFNIKYEIDTREIGRAHV